MGSFFNLDNKLFTFLSKVWDILVLSLIYIVLCLPVITIGPATTALYYTVVKVIRRDRGYVIHEFFHSFKTNFKNGAITGIILTIFYFIMYFDQHYARSLGGTQKFLLTSALNAILFILVSETIYVFPVLSRFTLNTKALFKTAFFMSVKHLPYTLVMMAILTAFAIACYITPIIIILIPGVCCLLCSFIMEQVLKKYMPNQSKRGEDNQRDEWYLE